MIGEAVQKLLAGENLSPDEMARIMSRIMSGASSTAEIVPFLTALADKGETVDEITAAARVMREHAIHISCASPTILDTCGTGGDRKNTFNISTTAAFVLAGCGITIAKHGNRSVSSRCGSADILEALGVTISMEREAVERCLNSVGIAFLYARDFHPAMKFAAEARKQIGRRTIFNILGPLCNPANATNQLIGVYAQGVGPVLAEVAAKLGVRHCLAVHGEGVLDEVTTAGWTEVNESTADGKVRTYRISPEDFGFARSGFEELVGGDPGENAGILLRILKGEKGPKRDIVLFNAGCAAYAADAARSIEEGISRSIEAIESGAALEKLEQLKDFTRSSHG